MPRFRIRAALSCAIGAAAIASSIAAQQAVPRPNPAPATPLAPGSAIILGRVVEAGTAAGVAGARVSIQSNALGSSGLRFADGTPSGSRTVLADANGRFVFRNLPAGAYSILVTSPGYLNGAYGETRVIPIRRTLDISRTLELTDADRPANVTIQMWKTGGILGQVVDDAGEPMVGAPVTVLARAADWGGAVTQQVVSSLTDDRGMYHADVPPGDYLVGLLAATTTVPVAAADAFSKAQAEGGAALQAYLDQVRLSDGVLARGNGRRVENFLVSQFGDRNAFVVPPLLTVAGQLNFYPSTYYPSSTSMAMATVVHVASGEEQSGVDIAVRPIPVVRVSGHVIGPSGPVPNITLRLVAADPTVMRTSPATLIDTPMSLADGNGDFTFFGVAPGPYTLFAFRKPASGSEPIVWAADTIAVGDRDVTGFVVNLQTGARIGGRVLVEGSKPLTPDALGRLAIVPRPMPGSPGSLLTIVTQARVDTAGRFVTNQIVAGAYTLTATGVPPGWTVKSAVRANGDNIYDRPFDLTMSGVDDIVVTLTDRISTLEGVARRANGEPAVTATVAVFPTDRALWRLPGVGSRRVQVAAPARDGRYSFRDLPSGEYFVVAVEWPSADFSDPQVLSALMPSATRVTIGEGQNVRTDLRVTVTR